MTYQSIPVADRGSGDEVLTNDVSLIDLLSDVIIELKIMNTHLSHMTDQEFTTQDIEEEVI